MSYDKNGNIIDLQRNGRIYADIQEIDNLIYNYEGNRLMKVTDSTNSPQGFNDGFNQAGVNDYSYDDNGNMIVDKNKDIQSIIYNHLNLPTQILFSGNNRKIDYIYNAVGQKVNKKVRTGNEYADTDYLSGFQYRSSYTSAQGDQSEATLQYFPMAEGYIEHKEGRFFYIYHYTDHLGNIRLSYTYDENVGMIRIMEENHYYPFGLKHESYNTQRLGYTEFINEEEVREFILGEQPKFVGDGSYAYKYNGKELQDELGLNWYDYGARNYDPALGRLMNVDPYAFLYFSTSSYAFIHNSPLIKVDPDGMRIIGVTKEDAKKANEDINKIFADKRFDQFRAMISLKGKEFNKIDGEKLKAFLKNSDLSSDDKHLIETVSNTINSDNDHFIEYKKADENLSTEFAKQLSVDSSIDTSKGMKAGLFGRGGDGITKQTKNGSFSLIIESEGGIGSLFEGANDYVNKEGGREHNPVGRPAIFGHEVFGHGRSYHAGLKTETEQHSEAIKMENLILRVMGNDVQRDGKNHSFGKPVENPSSLPTTK